MNNPAEPILKMRFRLPNGEEFEAEGPREFIERERNYFLALIGQQREGVAPLPTIPQAAVAPTISTPAPSSVEPKSYAPVPTSGVVIPAVSAPTPSAAPTSGEVTYHTELYLWERLFKEDGDLLILRRKAKLTMAEFATILIAGARVLLKKKSYSALEITKSLKASGGVIKGRLDRLLAPEIQAGRLIAQGAKRSRTYALTDEGFAKAFVLAERLSNPDSQPQEKGNTWHSLYPPRPRHKPQGRI